MPHRKNLLKNTQQPKQKKIPGKKNERFIHVHLFHHHVPVEIVILILLVATTAAIAVPALFIKKATQITSVLIPNEEGVRIEFTYGSWPALENAYFFETVKQQFVSEKTSFIEADLSEMRVRVYKEGNQIKEVPIISKGRPGSWWETPAGLYKVEAKTKNHFSSFGHVYMPYSMPFQGNFFIHGWPYYAGGEPVQEGYSGGCIRLSTESAEQVFSLADVGTPILVFEQSFKDSTDTQDFTYALDEPQVNASSYLAVDLENNFVFAEKKPDHERSIASLTKLMTALVSVEYINVERKVTIDPSMLVETSIPRIKSGNRYSVLDLLSTLLMESSNEAARAVAAPLGRTRFIQLMNIKAGAIGMEQSKFVDTSGVLAGNVSTAEDLFALAKYLYHNRSFVLHMSVGNENRAVYGPSVFQNLKNFNEIPEVDTLIGGKTGLSTSAGRNILGVFEIDIDGETRPVAVIVLGSEDSKRDIKAILEHIQTNYKRKAKPTPESV
jgi:D-alanyl-D-alanine carboxypeptidase